MPELPNLADANVASVSTTDLRSRFPNAKTLPLWPVVDGRCSCGDPAGCKRPGKHPKEFTDGTERPEDGYAIETGEDSGVFVVDPDVKGGVDGIKQLADFLGVEEEDLPETFTVRTSSGGLHLYFVHPGFHVANRKPMSAVDIKGDKAQANGLVYVVGPGSPGYIKTADPCVVVPGRPYTVDVDAPIVQAPELLLSWLRVGASRNEGFTPTPIDESHANWDYRIGLAIEACKTFAPSKADGEGGVRLFNLALRLVRRLELPLGTACELIEEHFNPRCSQPDGVTPYPWSEKDIWHKLTDASEKSDFPTGMLLQSTEEDIKALRERMQTRALERMNTSKAEPGTPHIYEIELGMTALTGPFEKITGPELINVLSGLSAHQWQGVLRYDTFRHEVTAKRPPIRLEAESGTFSEDDAERVAYWLACQMRKTTSSLAVLRAVPTVAKRITYNPLEEYFKSLPPAQGAIDELCDVLGVTGIERVYVRKYLLAAVRRAVRPGCKVDTVLALRGLPGVHKSSFVQMLFGSEWCSESLPSFEEKIAGEVMKGRWCVEMPELAAAFRTERNVVTAFVTRLYDTYRPAYARGAAQKFARSCVLFATINGTELYSDDQNADVRRIWVVDLADRTIDWSRVRTLRDAVWSEAYALTANDVWSDAMLVLQSGVEPHWLTESETALHNERADAYREEPDVWTSQIANFLSGKSEVTTEEVARHLSGDLIRVSKSESNRIAKVLKTIGAQKRKGVMRNGTKTNVWTVPEHLSTAKSTSKVLRFEKR